MAGWQRNLYVLWFSNFVLVAGFSLVMPFLPLYIEQMNVNDPAAVTFWTGLVFSANFFTAAIFSPVWGAMADRTGRRKMMIRSALGMAVIVGAMGLAVTVEQLFVLRLLQGVVAGFVPASVAFMSATAPKDRVGRVLGIMQTGIVAGSIIGPLLGGFLAHLMGYRHIFFVTGSALALAGLAVLLFVQEDFKPVASTGRRSFLQDLGVAFQYRTILAMLLVTFLINAGNMAVEPVLTFYLKWLKTPEAFLELAAGLVFSVTGVANALTAPFIGGLADRWGYKRVLLYSFMGMALLYLAQGLVNTPYELLAVRFFMGFFLSGLFPAANGLIAQVTPDEVKGRAFGLVTSANFAGNTVGPLLGGSVAAAWGIRSVFFVTAAILFFNLLWLWRHVPDEEEAGRKEPAEALG